MSGIPSATKSWTAGLLVNQRITFVSLLATLGTYITGITNQLIARGFTCVGSSNGVTAALDGVNRCTTAAGFAVRAANTTTAQSWIVVSDGSVQYLFTYTGASDDSARISMSPTNVFTIAGTTTFAPTAADELVVTTTSMTVVGSTASGDRVFHVWVDSAHKLWRAAIMRAGVLAGPLIGGEQFDASPLVTITAIPATWIFNQAAGTTQALNQVAGAYSATSNSQIGGLCRTSAVASTQLGGTCMVMGGSASVNDGVSLSANGGVPAIVSIGLNSVVAGAVGQIGFRYDWYRSAESNVNGATTTGLTWVFLSPNSTPTAGGTLWPWDGINVCIAT